jgi:hypothetical protein
MELALDGNEIGSGTQITVGLGTVAAIALALGKWLFGSSAKSLDDLKKAQEAQAAAAEKQTGAILDKIEEVAKLQALHATAQAVTNAEMAELRARIQRLEDENQRNRDERHRVAQIQSDALLKLADAIRQMPAAREAR